MWRALSVTGETKWPPIDIRNDASLFPPCPSRHPQPGPARLRRRSPGPRTGSIQRSNCGPTLPATHTVICILRRRSPSSFEWQTERPRRQLMGGGCRPVFAGHSGRTPAGEYKVRGPGTMKLHAAVGPAASCRGLRNERSPRASHLQPRFSSSRSVKSGNKARRRPR